MQTTSSYKEVRKLVRNGYKIGVIIGVDHMTIWLQKTDWLKETANREFLTDYDGRKQDFYINHNNKYVEFNGQHS